MRCFVAVILLVDCCFGELHIFNGEGDNCSSSLDCTLNVRDPTVLSMIAGSRKFHLTRPLVFAGSDSQQLCSNVSYYGNASFVNRIVALTIEANSMEGCFWTVQVIALERLGAAGIIISVPDMPQIYVTSWSSRNGGVRNYTSLPLVFTRSAILTDFMLFDFQTLQSIMQAVGPFFATMGSANSTSQWSDVAFSYGFVMQVILSVLSFCTITLAVISLLFILKDARPKKNATKSKGCNWSLALNPCTICLVSETVGGILRLIYFVVDPSRMWGTYSLEFGSFFNRAYISLTLFSVLVTSIFWVRVIVSKRRSGAGLREVWFVLPITLVVLVLLEWLDGILWFTSSSGLDVGGLLFVTDLILGSVCGIVAIVQIWSAGALFHNFRRVGSLQSDRASSLETGIKRFVIAEQIILCALTLVFFVQTFLDGREGNIAYWALETLYLLLVCLASLFVVVVYLRLPHLWSIVEELPPDHESRAVSGHEKVAESTELSPDQESEEIMQEFESNSVFL